VQITQQSGKKTIELWQNREKRDGSHQKSRKFVLFFQQGRQKGKILGKNGKSQLVVSAVVVLFRKTLVFVV